VVCLHHGVIDAGQLLGIELIVVELAREGDEHLRGAILLRLGESGKERDGFFQ
jgi:hypothetical protein